MEFAVVVKVVPDADAVGFDAERKTLRRDVGPLFLNPFDQRALRVALELRRPGEHVSVVSMGPPSAEPALRETVALGADRATLITDPTLAGSDTLVTARVLARHFARAPADVVFAGRSSTDSETGQVPPELAELLERPLVTSARRVTRSADGRWFEVVVDTDHGWAKALLSAPSVIGVGEKVGKPLHLTEEGERTVGDRSVERVSAASLGLSPFHVGPLGSPTSVGRLVDRTPTRRRALFSEGPVEQRVAAALAVVRSVLDSTPPQSRPATLPARVPGPTDSEVVALVTQESGAIDGTGLASLSELRRVVPRRRAVALWLGRPPTPSERAALASAGAEEVVEHESEGGITARSAAAAVARTLERRPSTSVALFPSTEHGRQVAGRVAARLGLGLTGDVVAVREGANGEVRFDKPAFGGGIIAEIACRTSPALATVRPGAFALGAVAPPPAIPSTKGTPVATDPSTRWLDRSEDPADGTADPATARVAFAVGVGAGSPESIAAVRGIAVAVGAALLGSRRVVDAGGLPTSRQVGLTGRSVAAELGVLLGVRGAANHMVGWRRTRALLAVDPDPSAAVFAAVDAGIVARFEEVLPLLAEPLSRWFPRAAAG